MKSYKYLTASFVSGKYVVEIGPVTENTRYWQNDEWKNTAGEIISTAGEVFSSSQYADYLSLGGNLIGLKDWSKARVYAGDVHIGFGQVHYFLNPNGWSLRTK